MKAKRFRKLFRARLVKFYEANGMKLDGKNGIFYNSKGRCRNYAEAWEAIKNALQLPEDVKC